MWQNSSITSTETDHKIKHITHIKDFFKVDLLINFVKSYYFVFDYVTNLCVYGLIREKKEKKICVQQQLPRKRRDPFTVKCLLNFQKITYKIR